jgi:glycosyltransferase involved in cell wall biosynthesis
MESDLITILLPVYNDERYLERSLRSIQNQTHTNFICLVGFNGTVDKSREVFQETVGKDPRFVSIDYGIDGGKSKTLNKLMEMVNTERVCLMDGDDVWHPEKMSHQVNLVKMGGDYDVIGTLATYINSEDQKGINIYLPEHPESIRGLILSTENKVINSSSMIKTSCIREVGGWDASVEGLEDFDMWVKFSLLGKKIYNIQSFLVYHRIHEKSNFNSKPLGYTTQEILLKNLDKYHRSK